MKLNWKIRSIIFCMIFAAGRLSAAEIYVSSASDIASALNNIAPGDTLTMTDGIWTDQRIMFKANGTADQPVLLRAQTPGKVKLTGKSNLRISGSYLVVDGLYFINGESPSGAVVEFRDGSAHAFNSRLTNSAIVNYNPSSKSIDYKWVSLYGQNNRVDHCYLRGKNHNGTTLVVWKNALPDSHLIDHNYFAYRPELGVNGGETIRIGTSEWSLDNSRTIVEYNYFEQCNGEIEIISNKSCENIYRYNTFVENEGALTLRHGNRCEVYGNFFFGNKKSNTGGVRIIGEDHTVYNNYFQDLNGDGYRSAIGMMNGVPNSPLNRYFQVTNARVLFNTIVNCKSPFDIGLGADSEKTLPPENCIIANNVVSMDNTNFMVEYEDDPINMFYEGNIMYGSGLGIDNPGGISEIDPMLSLAEDGLFRPAAQSPVMGFAQGDYSFINDDMDGQGRTGNYDSGADQVADTPVLRFPIGPEETGPSWYPPEETQIVIQVQQGVDSLLNAIQEADDGYVIELVSDGGVYENTANLTVTKNITIRAAEDLQSKPVIRHTGDSSTRILFEMRDGATLRLQGLDLDGMAGSDTPAKYLIRSDDDPMSKSYSLFVEDCDLHDVAIGNDGNFFRAYAGTFADSIVFKRSLFWNSGKEGIRLYEEAGGSGLYNVGVFEMENCTMWNTRLEAIHIYGGDEIPFTPGPRIRINHSTFYNCSYEGNAVINADDVDDTQITNSIISFSEAPVALQLDGVIASISYTDTFSVGDILLSRDAKIGNGMLGVDPEFRDPFVNDFTLDEDSPVRGMANDGKAMGDLRWSDETNALDSQAKAGHPFAFRLYDTYPNPFNATAVIEFSLERASFVVLEIFDVNGRRIFRDAPGLISAGEHRLRWDAGQMPSGLYILRVTANGFSQSRKMVLIR